MRRIAGVVLAGSLLVGCSSSGSHPTAKPTVNPILAEADAAPAAGPPSQQQVDRQRARAAARRAARELLREQNRPRHIQYWIRGSTDAATVTYTSTGNGTAQRTMQVLPQWRAVANVKLRTGAFAQVSAQNEREYGSVECKIVNLTDGVRQYVVAPATESSGAFAIVDCNGTVH